MWKGLPVKFTEKINPGSAAGCKVAADRNHRCSAPFLPMII
jgi:hypothetical protein